MCTSYIPILEVYGELLNESRKEKTKRGEVAETGTEEAGRRRSRRESATEGEKVDTVKGAKKQYTRPEESKKIFSLSTAATAAASPSLCSPVLDFRPVLRKGRRQGRVIGVWSRSS